MIEDVLQKIARQLLALNEDCLEALLPKYKERMINFTPTKEWEEAMLIYFMINGLRIKNSQFDEKIKEYLHKGPNGETSFNVRPKLRLVKFHKAAEDCPVTVEAKE